MRLFQFKWELGRANTGYSKLLLYQSDRFKFDIYLLKYPTGSSLDWHTDPCTLEGYNHWRFNFTLKRAKAGGVCQTIYPPTWSGWRCYFFRPDENMHRVTKIEAGTRYVLSFGFLRKANG